MKLFSYLLTLIIFATVNVLAHNLDEPGPHQGVVQMPASFHTELVKKKSNQFQVYLLDPELQNPSVAKSGVEFWYKTGTKEIQFKCEPKENEYFLCQTDSKVPAKGKITLKAYREGIIGNDAVYDVPFKAKAIVKTKKR